MRKSTTKDVKKEVKEEVNPYAEELKEAWDQYDRMGEGLLASASIGPCMRRMGWNVKEDELAKIIEDKCKGDKINFRDFLEVMTPLLKIINTKDYVSEAFKVLDPMDTGMIAVDDLRRIMRDFTEFGLPDEDIEAMVGELEANEEGKCIYADVVELMFK